MINLFENLVLFDRVLCICVVWGLFCSARLCSAYAHYLRPYFTLPPNSCGRLKGWVTASKVLSKTCKFKLFMKIFSLYILCNEINMSYFAIMFWDLSLIIGQTLLKYSLLLEILFIDLTRSNRRQPKTCTCTLYLEKYQPHFKVPFCYTQME